MKERPILFSGAMVRAILDGRKTQTRRIVKESHFIHAKYVSDGEGGLLAHDTYRCPYGKSGDRLWVRETWLPDPPADSDEWVDHTDTYVSWSGCGSRIDGVPPALRKPEHCIYREAWDAAGWNPSELAWRPGIHMPRWACRLVLQVTGVRVERLQDISEVDAACEGAGDPIACEGPDTPHRTMFSRLWGSINGAGAWEANPWVWTVEFRRIEV